MDFLFKNPSGSNPSLTTLYFVIIAWSFFWKGLALWNSAQNKQKYWFIALLILNTVGIVEIAYLFYFSKKKYTPATFVALFKR